MTLSEFQAVVLAAGQGSRITEITVSRPKCLLPVGDQPVLYHSLMFLQKAGFKDATVIVLSSALSQVSAAISKCDLQITPEYVAIPAETAEDWGTAESLQYLVSQERIKSDMVVVSCDLFTNCNLAEILLKFRQHDGALAALFFSPFSNTVFTEAPPGVKSKNKPEKDIVGIDRGTSRLVFLSSASDFEESVPIKRSTLTRHASISLRTDLLDGHVYVLSKKLAKFLTPTTAFSTLKGEFLPYVVSKQHTRPLAGDKNPQDKLGLLHECLKESKWDECIRNSSSFNDHKGDMKPAYHNDNIRCYAVVADSSHYAFRINSIPALWHANRLITNGEELLKGEKIHPTAEVQSNQVEDSYVGPKSKIQEKTSVRSSVISDNCVVKPRTRVVRSTLLRKVECGEGCVIENCVIGNDVQIGANCELKNCVVGSNHTVPPGTKASFQVLTQSDRLMEI